MRCFRPKYETWYLAIRGKTYIEGEILGSHGGEYVDDCRLHRLGVFENRVLWTIFGPKREEVTGVWRKLHNEKLHNLYSSPDIIRFIKQRRMRWAEHEACSMHGGDEKFL
jgi:hypothetical protein